MSKIFKKREKKTVVLQSNFVAACHAKRIFSDLLCLVSVFLELGDAGAEARLSETTIPQVLNVC